MRRRLAAPFGAAATLLAASLAALAPRLGAPQECPARPPDARRAVLHVSPHSHDDVGWHSTFMQYFLGTGSSCPCNVSQIIGAVVESLASSPERRFSLAEQAFFTTWFEAQSSAVQEKARRVVASGQLVFLGGGWSMSDEAAPSYVEILDNVAVGQRAIVANFGREAIPRLQWQIDPFGHSAFMGVLSSPLGGYTGIMWARESAELKLLSCASGRLERVWLPSPSLPHVATFQGVFVDSDYSSPDALGRCDYDGSPGQCGSSNAAGDVDALVADARGLRAPNLRGGDLLLNLGSDFTSENFNGPALNSNDNYTFEGNYSDYLDALVAAVNADGRYEARFSTPADYVAAKLAAPNATFPATEGDFFPYAQDVAGHRVWSGYFSSRPAFKYFVRESSALLQAARQLQLLAGGAADTGPSNALTRLERALGVALHHDAISGTATESTNGDYSLLASFCTPRAYPFPLLYLVPNPTLSLCAARGRTRRPVPRRLGVVHKRHGPRAALFLLPAHEREPLPRAGGRHCNGCCGVAFAGAGGRRRTRAPRGGLPAGRRLVDRHGR